MRRIVVLAEGAFGPHTSKTATGLIRFSRLPIVAVIDSTKAGHKASDYIGIGEDIPIVASIEEAMQFEPTTLILGTSPMGGMIPDEWRKIVVDAITHGLDVESGMHQFLSDDPEFVELSKKYGTRLVDYRKVPPEYNRIPDMQDTDGFVVLIAGLDSNIGKMTTAVELIRAAERLGRDDVVMAPTGQTGIMLEGWGIAIDHVLSDFLAGAVELLVRKAVTEHHGKIVLVEGQGSLYHPAYSGVALGLMHGSRPDGMILVHNPNRKAIRKFESVHLPPLKEAVYHHELIASFIKPSKVIGISVDTSDMDRGEAEKLLKELEVELGIPVSDPIRDGGEKLLKAIIQEAEKK